MVLEAAGFLRYPWGWEEDISAASLALILALLFTPSVALSKSPNFRGSVFSSHKTWLTLTALLELVLIKSFKREISRQCQFSCLCPLLPSVHSDKKSQQSEWMFPWAEVAIGLLSGPRKGWEMLNNIAPLALAPRSFFSVAPRAPAVLRDFKKPQSLAFEELSVERESA